MVRAVRRWLWIVMVFAGLPVAAIAAQDSSELLLPVSEQEVAKLMEKSNYRLRAQLYPAKRYRFVKINYKLLEQPDSKFSITPFDDLAAEVSAVRIEPANSSGQFVQWRGEIIDRRFPSRAIVLNVRSGGYQAPLSVARKIAAELRAAGESSSSFSAELPSSADRHATTIIDVKTVGGEWVLLTKGARLVLMPVEDDPRYHVVYEEDRTKVPNSAHGNPETTEKLRQQQEFMRNLETERAADQLKQNH
jgi:hypothetical protein